MTIEISFEALKMSPFLAFSKYKQKLPSFHAFDPPKKLRRKILIVNKSLEYFFGKDKILVKL